MVKLRVIYGVLILLTILCGLLSRYFTAIPLWVGSTLWGLMVYFIIRFLLIRAAVLKVAVVALGFSFTIEFLQLYQAPWINQIRNTLFGRLVLGQGFEWADLAAYTLGVLMGVLAERLTKRYL